MALTSLSTLWAFSLFFVASALAFKTNSTNFYNDGRIINGTVASVNATKHQVSIRRRLNDGYFFGTGHICGGSLIAPNVVLTAAHCFVDQVIYDGTFLPHTDFIVVMGTLDRFEKNNFTLSYDIEKVVFDLPIFNLSTYDKDIALLFLNDSVPESHPTVKPIFINRHQMAANTTCQATGWGVTEEGYVSDVLKTVDLPVIDTEVCSKESAFQPGAIREGMMCAGYLVEGERDACNGDSGGPLVCEKALTGIISWGYGCAKPWLPGVYTDVAFWAPWIDEKLKAENITIPGEKDGALSSLKSSVTLLIVFACMMNGFNIINY